MNFIEWFFEDDKKCDWIDYGLHGWEYKTSCGIKCSPYFLDIKNMNFKFCPYCGKPIEEKKPIKEVE